ncbi:MAG: phosphate ABC transporter substrate-binding protein [Candidatus Saganbacteria bacterium]|nr:phosphate ABC transporter substrate-binding protein [Candidatus Saganbacteria bacterium]
MRKNYLLVSCVIILACFLVFSISSCASRGKIIKITGSDTMVNLSESWVENFMAINPTIPIAITGGGSGTGIASLISGTTDIAQSSRSIEKKELAIAKEKGMTDIREFTMGHDGIVVSVNPKNPINQLTEQQLSKIFRGEAKNWKEFGGNNIRIVVLSRERNSGTHVFFLERIVKLGKKKDPAEFGNTVLMMPSSQAIVEEIRQNPGAIGYYGLGYLTDKEKALKIAKNEKSLYIGPTVKTISDSIYPISRPLYFYTNGAPSENIKKFIAFALGPEGQKIVLEMGFVPGK